MDAKTVGTWNGARREMEFEGWRLVRTLRGGTKAMREAREEMTPKTDIEHSQPRRYETRLKHSVLYPAYDDRVRSLASLPFQKELSIEGELDEPLDRLIGDADRCGTSLAAFCQSIYEDAIDRGMGLFLVDNVPTDGMTLVDADMADARPYFLRIAPDNLIGFSTDTFAGRDVVTELRYREWLWRPGDDGLDRLVDRIRVWTTTDVYIWEKITGERDIDREAKAALESGYGYRLVESFPHGFAMGIPLVAVYTNKVATLQAKPALLDLAYLNVAHWESCSIQGSALRYSRSPILKVSGASHEVAEQRPITGPGATIIDTSDTLDIGFVEIAGTSLAAGEREIDMLRLQMEALGMRPMMAAQGPQTATGEVRADMAEKSRAQAWVEALEWAIYQAFRHAATWVGQTLADDFDITLFKDSSLIAGKATDIPTLGAMASQRHISLPTYLREVKARGVLVTVDDVDAEVEAIRVEAEEAVQRQMDAMANRFIAEREAGEVGPPGEGTVPPRRPGEDETEDDQDDEE